MEGQARTYPAYQLEERKEGTSHCYGILHVEVRSADSPGRQLLHQHLKETTYLPTHGLLWDGDLSVKRRKLDKETQETFLGRVAKGGIAWEVGSRYRRDDQPVIVGWGFSNSLSIIQPEINSCHTVRVDKDYAGVVVLESLRESESRVVDSDP